ncbi:MiaB-like tRNA modifying enzyme [Desulfonauticus submarinus]|uniref:MiaB-like tRNA modifying enzyme n=1 Tax=Desulfonauticus submarinus TaxID=206665 RepID=A0A1H0CM14_9BACT|nr:tRNA (N(6)-L-threonylcarbamoyladenosine(37)-C(2))-methylthiotransferase MtaB [Desulfonauticus submarinus]SDN58882.1 MiaB-like tRNA modifying enzyme [Desulfonauticus submarinus]
MNFKTFFIKTLGCKVNQYETQAIIEILQNQNKMLVSEQKAEVIILNSCAVTQGAFTDLKKSVRHFVSINPTAKIIVIGCAAQVLKDKISLWPEVNTIIPQDKKFSFFQKTSFNNPFPNINNYFRARAVLKVQDGCSHHCTYCIVPLTRGKSISRKPKDILLEIKRLAQAGFKEIILSGINLRQYGRDLENKMNFWELIDFLGNNFNFLKHNIRIRLSSIEPADLTTQALLILKTHHFICPHLHISLQSGSNTILKKMGRGHYKAENLLDFCAKLNSIWPIYGLGLDLLVGFPGETEQNFNHTYELVNKLPLSYAHVFPYSPRPNTKAINIPDQVPQTLKKQRTKLLRELVQNKRKDFYQKVLKLHEVNVIVENSNLGTTEHYLQVKFTEPTNKPIKSVQKAKPIRIENDRLLVKLF